MTQMLDIYIYIYNSTINIQFEFVHIIQWEKHPLSPQTTTISQICSLSTTLHHRNLFSSINHSRSIINQKQQTEKCLSIGAINQSWLSHESNQVENCSTLGEIYSSQQRQKINARSQHILTIITISTTATTICNNNRNVLSWQQTTAT